MSDAGYQAPDLTLVGVEHVAIGSDLDVVGNPNAVNGGGFDPRTQPNFARYQYHEDGDGVKYTGNP